MTGMNRFQEEFPLIEGYLQERAYLKAKEALSSMEPADVAEGFEALSPTHLVLYFRLLPKDQAIEVFELMDSDEQQKLIQHVTDSEVAEIIEEMSDDDRTELFDELPAKTVKKLLRQLSPTERILANRLLNYPEDSAGRIMTPEFIDLKSQMTAEEAVVRIRATARKKETIYTCFVIDEARHLLGVVELEDLIMAEPHTRVEAIMDDDPVCTLTTSDQEDVAKLMSRYDIHTIPVTDKEERLVGIVTFDDVLDILEEEATEDFERMAGIQPVEDSYLDVGLFTMARKRFVWLVICILTEALTSSVLKHYSCTIQSVVSLTFFIPLLIGTGGNAGTQASTLMIRGMTIGDIKKKDIGRILLRETGSGLLLGGALALLGLARAFMLETGPEVAFTLTAAIVAVVLMGNLAGAVLPLIARFLKLDPAIMSGPFITTIVDVFGLIVYFEIARVVLRV
ncbi:MAG: magnesium transporter [Dethiosulfovibrio peptidovorans]|nr:MAG: magnesium transporter [Dethiosulfovibrio peptidovorans]